MSKSVAFFPWLSISEPITVGPLRLLPYERRRQPGSLKNLQQRDIDAILKAYALRPRHKVESATLMELGGWNSGDDASEVVGELFKVRELIAFSGLAKRRFFSHSDYTNYDSYALTVQSFHEGQGDTFAFTTRRRDGGGQYLWGSDEFAFHIPLHVESNQDMLLDRGLLQSLLEQARNRENLLEAIKEFNAANTDSSIIPVHVELVMLKSAWEALLQISESASTFQTALLKAVGDTEVPFPKGTLCDSWKAAYGKCPRLLAAWAREFCKLRGKAAHGAGGSVPAIWSESDHLLFGAMLFPLVFKKILSASNPDVLGCCRFHGHLVKVENETGGWSWEREGNSAGSSSLKL